MSKKENKKKFPYNTFRKGIVAGILGLTLSVGSFGLAGCSLGVSGADGQDGADGTNGLNGAQWYTGEEVPTTDGVNGDFFLDTDDYILYQKVNGQWMPIMYNFGKPGNDGADGIDGTNATADNIELQVASGKVQWRYKTGNDTIWKDLIEVSTITGADGNDGADGADGKDGREIELQVGSEYIQWRYTTGEDTAWKNLMPISSLKGTDGATWLSGTTEPTNEGTDGDFYLNESNYDIYKKTDGAWNKIGNIKGDTGSAGSNGSNGQDGTDGATWLTGTEITGTGTSISANIDSAKVGDLYLNTDTCDVYSCVSENVWDWITNIKGDRGPTVEEYALEVLKGALDNMSCENGYSIVKLYSSTDATSGNTFKKKTVETYNSEDGSWSSAYPYYDEDSWDHTVEQIITGVSDNGFTAKDGDNYYLYNFVPNGTSDRYAKKYELSKEEYDSYGPDRFNNTIKGLKDFVYEDNLEAVKANGIAYAKEQYGEAIPDLEPEADVSLTKTKGQYTLTLTLWDEDVSVAIDNTTTIPGANVEMVFEIVFTEDGVISYSTSAYMTAKVDEQDITQGDYLKVTFGEYDASLDVDFGEIVKKEWFDDTEE